MSLARVKTWNPGDVLTAADLNGEFNNILNNPSTLISPLSANLNVNNKQLTALRLENLTAIQTAAQSGRIYFNTGTNWPEVDDGTNIRALRYPRSYLAGLTLSNDGTSPNTVLDIAAGEAMDSTNVLAMSTAAITKTTAAWAVGTGNGGLDTGAVAAATWYHVWLIMRVDTGVVDALISTSATAPTMPTSYTLKRRIGSFRTAAATTNILAFIQDGDLFQWMNPTTLGLDVSVAAGANPGTAAITRTLNVPTGVNVVAIMYVELVQGATRAAWYFSDLATTDVAAATEASPLGAGMATSGATGQASAWLQIRTNTSAQIRSRLSFSDASTQGYVQTTGWWDYRGRNS